MIKLIRKVATITLLIGASTAFAATHMQDDATLTPDYPSQVKLMDSNSDGKVSKDEYMKYHEQQFSKMKKTNGFVIIKDMTKSQDAKTNKNSMNNAPIGTTTGKSENGSVDITDDGPINGTQPGTN